MTVESPLRKAEQEIARLNEYIETMMREKGQLNDTCGTLMEEVEQLRTEKEGLTHELRCARVEIDGCQGELRNAASEKERVLVEFNKDRGVWKEREEELITTSRVLDDELRDAQGKVGKMEEKVFPLTRDL